MPRSIHEIIKRADRSEAYEPAPDDKIDVATHELRRAALGRARSERRTTDTVGDVRRAVPSCEQIGTELGVSSPTAQRR